MLNNLKPTEGSRKTKTRRCRGLGSGLGKNGGSGSKGQNSRTGGGVRLGFEGGQLPLFRRLPKRGFKHFGKKIYATVNLKVLNRYNDGEVIDLTRLVSDKVIKKEFNGLKVLGEGELTKKITIKANKFSESALEKINKAGAKAEVL
ncbi:MAG: 50S ribosomal protein L15 [Firmicutes bacterium]|uniref:Large ribosomal subunit protein uL15 n=1 Tax=Candidatus Onthovivens merdipullorum TaxID=2840889 RepID=A0A9D9GX99_9BACL|nr:50S ribosomal protein L15 [Candidatus Onthovivens merdipullorum]